MLQKRLIGFLLLLLLAAPAQAQQQLFLVGRTIGYKYLHDGDSVRIFGFDTDYFTSPLSPGPTLYMNEGDSVELEFFNFSQGAPHTIHLHGLDVNQANDGVPHLSFEVYHMESGFYRFTAPHAGTYLYHCHVVSAVHVQAGMYGLIIVRPPDGSNTTWDGGYAFDQEHAFFMSEVDVNWHLDSVLDHDYDTTMTTHMVPVPEYHPQYFLVNGYSEQQLDTAADFQTSIGAVNYLRMSNIGYYGNRIIFPSIMDAQIISSDGRPLPQIDLSDTLEIYPGERFGILSTSNIEYTDSIAVEYFDLNTGIIHDTQYIEIKVEGVFGTNDLEQQSLAFNVWPNPSNGLFTLDFATLNSKKTIQVYDHLGRIIAGHTTNLAQYQLDLSTVASGVYFVEVIAGDRRAAQRIIIQ